jgi:hypothetical protein
MASHLDMQIISKVSLRNCDPKGSPKPTICSSYEISVKPHDPTTTNIKIFTRVGHLIPFLLLRDFIKTEKQYTKCKEVQ